MKGALVHPLHRFDGDPDGREIPLTDTNPHRSKNVAVERWGGLERYEDRNGQGIELEYVYPAVAPGSATEEF